MEDSGAAAGAMQASQQLGATLGWRSRPVFAWSPAAPGARDPETFSAGADEFIAATALAVVVLPLVVVAAQSPKRPRRVRERSSSRVSALRDAPTLSEIDARAHSRRTYA